MTPDERQRRAWRREMRRDAGRAFVAIAVMLVLLIAGGMVAVAYVEGTL